MGNLLDGKKKIEPKTVNVNEFKTYVGLVEIKIGQQKQKKLREITNKRKEIGKCLLNNQLEIAKLKMENIISDEDHVVAFDILSTLIEILKEKVVYLISSDKCPEDMRATLDTVIWCSTRFDITELHKIREAVAIKYGSLYVNNALNNTDKLVNLAVIERLSVKNHPSFMLLTRIKQVAIEDKIEYYFPPEFDNPTDGNPSNSGGQDFFPNNSVSSGLNQGYDPFQQKPINNMVQSQVINQGYDPYQNEISKNFQTQNFNQTSNQGYNPSISQNNQFSQGFSNMEKSQFQQFNQNQNQNQNFSQMNMNNQGFSNMGQSQFPQYNNMQNLNNQSHFSNMNQFGYNQNQNQSQFNNTQNIPNNQSQFNNLQFNPNNQSQFNNMQFQNNLNQNQNFTGNQSQFNPVNQSNLNQNQILNQNQNQNFGISIQNQNQFNQFQSQTNNFENQNISNSNFGRLNDEKNDINPLKHNLAENTIIEENKQISQSMHQNVNIDKTSFGVNEKNAQSMFQPQQFSQSQYFVPNLNQNEKKEVTNNSFQLLDNHKEDYLKNNNISQSINFSNYGPNQDNNNQGQNQSHIINQNHEFDPQNPYGHIGSSINFFPEAHTLNQNQNEKKNDEFP